MLKKLLMNGFYLTGMNMLFAPVTSGVGSIFMLHHVDNIECKPFSPNCHLWISPEFLNAMLLRLKLEGHDFITMDEAVERLRAPSRHTSDKPFITVTLDDGYRNNLTNAAPVFRRHNIPYTIYIAPDLVDRTATLWWEDLENIIAARKSVIVDFPEGEKSFDTSTDAEKKKTFVHLIYYLVLKASEPEQRELIAKLADRYQYDAVAHVDERIMNWSELAELQKDPLCTLGAHTMGHHNLAKLDPDEAEREITESRDRLEKETGVKPEHFAYPYGYPQAAGQREFELAAKLGFKSAVTTRHGVLYEEHGDHMTALPRVSINGSHQSMRYIRTLIAGLPTRVKNFGSKLDVA